MAASTLPYWKFISRSALLSSKFIFRQKLYCRMASKQICLFKARVLQKKKHPWIISFLQFAQSNLCVCLKSNNKHIIQSKWYKTAISKNKYHHFYDLHQQYKLEYQGNWLTQDWIHNIWSWLYGIVVGKI